MKCGNSWAVLENWYQVLVTLVQRAAGNLIRVSDTVNRYCSPIFTGKTATIMPKPLSVEDNVSGHGTGFTYNRFWKTWRRPSVPSQVIGCRRYMCQSEAQWFFMIADGIIEHASLLYLMLCTDSRTNSN